MQAKDSGYSDLTYPGYGQPSGPQPRSSGPDIDVFHLEANEPVVGQQHIEQWLFSNPASRANSAAGSRTRFDEWLDMGSFLDPPLPVTQLDNFGDAGDMLDNPQNDHLFEDSEYRTERGTFKSKHPLFISLQACYRKR